MKKKDRQLNTHRHTKIGQKNRQTEYKCTDGVQTHYRHKYRQCMDRDKDRQMGMQSILLVVLGPML
jgi:hypothetical protein